MAIAAANGHKLYKTDTKQAFLYGDMGEDIVYLHPPDWWPESIPACPAPSQEHLWHQTNGAKMAQSYFRVDD
jgi:hypothetical protein